MLTECIENIVFTIFVLHVNNFLYAKYGSYYVEYTFDNVFVNVDLVKKKICSSAK